MTGYYYSTLSLGAKQAALVATQIVACVQLNYWVPRRKVESDIIINHSNHDRRGHVPC